MPKKSEISNRSLCLVAALNWWYVQLRERDIYLSSPADTIHPSPSIQSPVIFTQTLWQHCNAPICYLLIFLHRHKTRHSCSRAWTWSPVRCNFLQDGSSFGPMSQLALTEANLMVAHCTCHAGMGKKE